MDVYFYEVFDEEAEALRRLLGTDLTYDMTWKTVQEAGHTEPPARIISTRTQSNIPAAWSSSLDAILSRSTGYDHLVEFLRTAPRQIPCGYLDEYATRAVAEHAVLLVHALLRRLPAQLRQAPAFVRDGITGREIPGKHFLVVGVGRIGSEIHGLAHSLGFDVRGVDLIRKHADVSYVEKEMGIRWADVVVSAMNLTEDNRGYFRYETLRMMRPGGVFVNVARGEQAPLDGIVRLLEEGHLGGVGLDVFESEGTLANALRAGEAEKNVNAGLYCRLQSLPNVILTPHNAFNSVEAVERKSEFTVRQIFHFLSHHDFLWKV